MRLQAVLSFEAVRSAKPNESEPDGRGRGVAPSLGPLEARVMRLLWVRGSGTVPELVEAVRGGGHPAAYTTVLTVVSRLYERGLLEREAEGRTHRYRPAVSETDLVERASASAVADILARYGSVAMRQFAIRLADLDPETRRQLMELAEARDTDKQAEEPEA